jgi:cellulose synthase (UDP-forming)
VPQIDHELTSDGSEDLLPRDAKYLRRLGFASWVAQLGAPRPEATRSRRLAHLGGIAAIAAPALYLTWRIGFTLPGNGWSVGIAWALVVFEALPIAGLILKTITVWNIDSHPAPPPNALPAGMRVAVLIPTYNEPVEVLSPTIAAACDLEPAHETWVLDDGDRPWVAEMCSALGARYVCRPTHDHAKAGNMNHALQLMVEEKASGSPGIDIIAVLDCDHVPLPTFLTATIGWFADPEIALVQGPQCFYNVGAFDDDGLTGEQGVFFNVLMPSRNTPAAGPFWCGSTSLLRVSALEDVGGVATETITEDMHTTLKLIRRGWKTVYHHQTLAVGLAPSTPDQYLLQRRRWGLGAMQILTHEKLWAAKSWMSWRNYNEYLNGTLWWLEGITTLLAFAVPFVILFTGAQTSTASPPLFILIFAAMFAVRLWGSKKLMRGQIDWSTAFALRIFRIPVGLACLWWLITRRTLDFEVTPKGAAQERMRGRIPRFLLILTAIIFAVIAYAVAGVLGWVPWRTDPASTVAATAWLGVAGIILVLGIRRIRAAQYATSRRDAYRVGLTTEVYVDGLPARLQDISMGGASVRLSSNASVQNVVNLKLPGTTEIPLDVVRVTREPSGSLIASLQIRPKDWKTYQVIALWLFHTPHGVIPGWPPGIPAVASLREE